MKKWIVYRDHETRRFCNQRMFDGETHEVVHEDVCKPIGIPAGTHSYTATFVRVLRDGEQVMKVEGELYDVVSCEHQREVLLLVSRLNGVAEVMES